MEIKEPGKGIKRKMSDRSEEKEFFHCKSCNTPVANKGGAKLLRSNKEIEVLSLKREYIHLTGGNMIAISRIHCAKCGLMIGCQDDIKDQLTLQRSKVV